MSDQANRAVIEALVNAINRADRGALDYARDGRIARETAYWSKPFAAPDWRKQWVEQIA